MVASNGQYFKQVVKGENFLTPKLSGYFLSGDYECEVSRGRGLNDVMIYGVTVVNTSNMKHELSKAVPSLYEAKKYIKSLEDL